LRNKGYDYWALGHIHQRAELSPKSPGLYSAAICRAAIFARPAARVAP
jgi:DNA repair exonuclease SbcCD nuclease subunit